MTRSIEFSMIGEQQIHCPGCEQRIGNALRRLAGVQNVQASAQTQHVVVMIDPVQVSVDQIRDRLEQLGYQVMLQGDTR